MQKVSGRPATNYGVQAGKQQSPLSLHAHILHLSGGTLPPHQLNGGNYQSVVVVVVASEKRRLRQAD